MEKSLKNPLFILGYPRSGTTLLRALLGSHTKIHLLHESELIHAMRSAGISVSEPIKRENYPQILEQLQKINVCRRHLSALPSEKISELINCPDDLSLKEIYEFLLPKPENVEIWGEKSLGNVFHIPELRELYQNAVFVNIIRDPRAALLSHYRKRFATSSDYLPVFERRSIRFFVHGAVEWKRWLDSVNTARDLFGDDVIVQVRYEDLITEPEKHLKRICAKVGVEFEPDMMNESLRKNDPVVAAGVSNSYAHHRNLAKPINPKRAAAGNELPKWASYIIEKYTADDLRNLGYNLKKEPIDIVEKMRINTETLLNNTKKKIRLKVNKMGFSLGK